MISCISIEETSAPAPVLPIPTAEQLSWQEMEFYAFVHFNMNTFTDQEWGFGDEDPTLFNPTELDCMQWAKVCKEAGMKGIILTAKHHDGFCLWPSAYTEHSVKNAPWRDGKGDLVQELADACQAYGLELGIYYSPWDRNHADYGTPVYMDYMRNQLTELMSNYGSVFEVWFDGANGGTGYYGGANEERRVDKQSYYDWPNTHALVKKLQPQTLIFSDAGPDVRWVGNEEGYAYETMWSNLLRDSVYAGMPEYSRLYASGQENGTHFVPGETNVSIRPGWYYHAYEDHKVRSLPAMVDMYYQSIGRNTNFLLNFPVDRRGLIHENDVARLEELKSIIDADFSNPIIRKAKVEASIDRGHAFRAVLVADQNPDTYWAAPDGVLAADLQLEFQEPRRFNRLLLQEYLALGQRVKAFDLQVEKNGNWETIAEGTTIGYKRILRFPETEATRIRIRILDAKACPTLAEIELYHAPATMIPPKISRNQKGWVKMESYDPNLKLYYTVDGTEPNVNSPLFQDSFLLLEPALLRVLTLESNQGLSVETQERFGQAAARWKILEEDPEAIQAIDGNPNTWWINAEGNSLSIDLGESLALTGFTYLPMQGRWITGFIDQFSCMLSEDGSNWSLVKEGEFANIKNNPIEQRVNFPRQKARYIKLEARHTIDNQAPSFGSFGVILEPN